MKSLGSSSAQSSSRLGFIGGLQRGFLEIKLNR